MRLYRVLLAYALVRGLWRARKRPRGRASVSALNEALKELYSAPIREMLLERDRAGAALLLGGGVGKVHPNAPYPAPHPVWDNDELHQRAFAC